MHSPEYMKQRFHDMVPGGFSSPEYVYVIFSDNDVMEVAMTEKGAKSIIKEYGKGNYCYEKAPFRGF